jgi:hypothetical protein
MRRRAPSASAAERLGSEPAPARSCPGAAPERPDAVAAVSPRCCPGAAAPGRSGEEAARSPELGPAGEAGAAAAGPLAPEAAAPEPPAPPAADPAAPAAGLAPGGLGWAVAVARLAESAAAATVVKKA